ncbi:MAG: hypothetical protein AMXMBFR59_35270 [Rhodanobacteraceae bacterium]
MTDRLAVPFGPVHVSDNVWVGAVNGPVSSLPAGGLLPCQFESEASDVATQLIAFDARHVTVALPPLDT